MSSHVAENLVDSVGATSFETFDQRRRHKSDGEFSCRYFLHDPSDRVNRERTRLSERLKQLP